MAINSKKDQITGLLKMKYLVSNSTILKKSKELLLSKYNAMVPFNKDTFVIVKVENRDDLHSFYLNNNLTQENYLNQDLDVFVITISEGYFKNNLDEIFPMNLESVNYVKIDVV